MPDEETSPVDQLIDLLVYAPVGLLYEYDEVIPKLVKRGRSQVQLAKVIGKLAFDHGGGDSVANVVEGLASMVARRITEIGAEIGLAPPTGEPGSRSSSRSDDTPSAPTPSAPTPAASSPPAPEPTIEGEIVADEPDGVAGGDQPLPIAGYDELTAREIVGLLEGLDAGQLARVRSHEQANRARKTVLGKLDRLGV